MKGLNECSLPTYLQKGRLVPLSKKKGVDTVKVEDIRPIVVKSHISKICEKKILNKIQKGKEYLIHTKNY